MERISLQKLLMTNRLVTILSLLIFQMDFKILNFKCINGFYILSFHQPLVNLN